MLIDTLLSFGGIGYSIVTGIRQGKQLQDLLARVSTLRLTVERVTPSILYVPTMVEVSRLNETIPTPPPALPEVRAALEPVQRSLGHPIIATGGVQSPDPLRKALSASPWDVLLDVRPVDRAVAQDVEQMVAITFIHQGTCYIGWQKRGVLPFLFGLEYHTPSMRGPSTAHHALSPGARLGRVVRILPDKGFGFIRAEDNAEELFFHRSFVRELEWSILKEGDLVEFVRVAAEKGPRAERIKKLT